MEHDLKFWKKLATDMAVVLGNNPYMAKATMKSMNKTTAIAASGKLL